MKPENHQNRLIDELMREHRRQHQADDPFLEALEQRLDAEEVHAEQRVQKSGITWVSGLGLAACLAFGVLGYQWYQSSKQQDLELTNVTIERQVARQESAIQNSDETRSLDMRNSMRKQLTNAVKKVPAAPSSSLSKVIAANTSSDLSLRLPKKKEKALHFGASDCSGNGWGKDNAVAEERVRDGIGRGVEAFPQKGVIDTSNEKYGEWREQAFIVPLDKETRRSTFAIDVDTASYANVRRWINDGSPINLQGVRVEEMINYFHYNYPQPKGEHPFSVSLDQMDCPWAKGHKLVRIGLKGKDIVRSERPASNLVFLLDVSGSMSASDKLPLLKRSMQFLIEELNDKDSVSIVVYAGASGLALPATKMDSVGKQKVLDTMDKLDAGGSTAGGEGIKLAYQVAKDHFVKNGVNRVILATDGDFNVGISETGKLKELIEEKAKSGTYLSVLGFGRGNLNDEMLETITNAGNGNYSYIDSIKEGRKVLLEDMLGTMVTIAKDVKIQVEFNPRRVQEYRLIGYNNRVLPNEAFLDKKADAGEIGAGHTVTALYEIIPGDAKDAQPKDQLRYAAKKQGEKTDLATLGEMEVEHNDELLFVKLAYKRPDAGKMDASIYFSEALAADTKVDASADMQFAAAVALFGMQLSESEYAGRGDLELVKELAEAGKGNDGKGLRAEFCELVEKMKKRTEKRN